MLNTCVHPDGRFRVGAHQPAFTVRNLRARDCGLVLGRLPEGAPIDNRVNFPAGDIEARAEHPVYEIRNPLPFRGATYIDGGWAAKHVANPSGIAIAPLPEYSLRAHLRGSGLDEAACRACVAGLPLQLRYALAATSADAEELVWLAESCCEFLRDESGNPVGLLYEGEPGRARPKVANHELFETIANNPHLPDRYKEIMVLRPGAQGDSPISADERHEGGHIFEYLRANSYIPGGHYAANFAHDSRRYRIGELSLADMRGVRHLYYQRVYTALAQQLGLEEPQPGCQLSEEELEELRLAVVQAARDLGERCPHPAALWGWNFGYDFSASGFRLHASHQMIHQQYALVPEWAVDSTGERLPAYACGDLVAVWLAEYRARFGSDFFADYLKCIMNNTRADGGPGESSLVVWRDDNALLFVPKAQVSQWELNLLVTADCLHGPVGNVAEADGAVRASIDRAMLLAQQVLERLGARMVTSIEYGKRLGIENGQRLLYSFLPKLPWAMGGFTEAQGRYVCGHYPEDFAKACRMAAGVGEGAGPGRALASMEPGAFAPDVTSGSRRSWGTGPCFK